MDYAAIRKNFENHGFSTQLFSTGQEAVEYLAGKLQGRTIGFGGSLTLRELGLYETLCNTNAVVWHHKVLSDAVRRLARQTNTYISSANAVAATGQIVNIDGAGNRLAMTAYGPEECYYVVGKNKIAPDLESAMYRSRNVAAPLNAQRLKASTPCAQKGDKCYDCNSPDRLCRLTLIVDRAPLGMHSEIIFVDQDLGY